MMNNNNVAQKAFFPQEAENGKAIFAANLISTIFSPALCILYAVIMTALSVEHPSKIFWLALFVFLFVLAPTSYIFYLIGRGKVTDFHINIREERIKPICIVIAYCVFSLALYHFAGGPSALVSMGVFCLVLASFWLLISLYWKISGHCAGIGAFSAGTLGYSSYEVTALVVIPLVLLVVWARIKLGCHTFLQTLAGLTLGISVFYFFGI